MEESTADQGSPEPLRSEQLQEGTAEVSVSLPVDVSRIDPKKIAMAEEMGIPVGQLIQWASSVEARLQAIQEHLPELAQAAMERAIENIRKKQIVAMQQAGGNRPAGAGAGGFGMRDLIGLLSSGGGHDAELMNLTKDMYKLNIEAMKEDIGFTRAIKNALVSKIAGKTVGKLLEE